MMPWQKLLHQNITSVENSYSSPFPTYIPKRLFEKITGNTEEDPIARQFLPMKEEAAITPSFCPDPLSETSFLVTPRLLHKYQKRVLFMTTSACAMHCRFCFRRCFSHAKGETCFDEELDWLKAHTDIEEIILSGGDPLSLPDHILIKLFHSLSTIPHIKTVRIHTRFPIGIPERIDESFLSCLAVLNLQKVLVLHTNHPLELDQDVREKMHLLHAKGVLLLSQTVLLKGVNDRVAILEELMRRLIDCRILPYYLHQLDRVQGTGHFEVSEEEGHRLVTALRERLPGYAVPRYVKEHAFEKNKSVLC